MPLTALQRTAFESYRTFRESPPTFWRLMAHASRGFAIVFIIFSLGSILLLYLEVSESAGWFYAGLGVGLIWSNIKYFRFTVRIWPVLARVLDWQKIDDLLDGNEVDDSWED